MYLLTCLAVQQQQSICSLGIFRFSFLNYSRAFIHRNVYSREMSTSPQSHSHFLPSVHGSHRVLSKWKVACWKNPSYLQHISFLLWSLIFLTNGEEKQSHFYLALRCVLYLYLNLGVSDVLGTHFRQDRKQPMRV